MPTADARARTRHAERLHDDQAARLQPELRRDVGRRGRHRHAPAATRAVAMRAEAETHGPIRYLINTEHHVDHIFGNYWYRGGPVVNHQGLYDNFMDPKAALDPFDYALEAIPTDDPDGGAAHPRARRLLPDRQQGHDRVHRRPDPAGRRPHVPLPVDAWPYAGPARGPRARGARGLHRRHDLQRMPDLADDLERRPVARGARADPPARRRLLGAGPRTDPVRSSTSTPNEPCS